MGAARCRRCHRVLKTPECVAAGFGKVCFRKVTGKTLSAPKKERAPRASTPKVRLRRAQRQKKSGVFRKDIICSRGLNGGAVVNIKQEQVLHSPTGFEWGYGGSGPADLALNILCRFVPVETARQHHQQFKWDFVAKMPMEGGTIKNTAIREWLKERGILGYEDFYNAEGQTKSYDRESRRHRNL